ncbi:site-specific integrase [Costertonia aggregata]|uniref:Site-specific integrase n=1 Tax=Costertonia aggregata TaxID=343403 RepID=A0A7H9APK2_9FLAO|nr:site-specific integrase [Costertonia aggregata]QLG45401.1 site-specific integrase [Costertonia aggregata]
MSQQKLKIRFVIIKAKINKKGKCPLSCRLTLNGKRKVFATGEFVSPNNWDAKLQSKVNSSDSTEINSQLEIISSKIRKTYLSLQLDGKKFTVDDIFQKSFGNSTKIDKLVVGYFKEYLYKLDKLIGKDLELATWKKYNYSCRQLEQFVKWKYKKNDYPMDNLKLQFLLDFEYYLKTELNQVQATINKTIQRVRKPIKIALIEGYLKNDPFVAFKPKKVVKEVVFLSNEELSVLENHKFTQIRLELVRDLFVFCCYTGLAYGEMSSLRKEHIIKGFDGNKWIQMKRRKTGKLISIPILPKAESVFLKYRNSKADLIFPKLSNQKINSYLKEIADIVGIEKRVTHHTARKTFASTVLLYNDVSMETVSELLGHSSIKTTQDYYGKVVLKKVSKEMILLNKKLSKG